MRDGRRDALTERVTACVATGGLGEAAAWQLQNSSPIVSASSLLRDASSMQILRSKEAGADSIALIGSVVSEAVRLCDAGEKVDPVELVRWARAKHRGQPLPKLVDIVAALPHSHKQKLAPVFQTKPVRTASGVCCITCGHPLPPPPLTFACRSRSSPSCASRIAARTSP